MTRNDVSIRYNILKNLKLEDSENKTPSKLKAKIIRLLIAYSDVELDTKQILDKYIEQYIPLEYKDLSLKKDKTLEDALKLEQLNNSIQEDFREFQELVKSEEVILKVVDSFTEDDFDEIIEFNYDNDVVINDLNVSSSVLLLTFSELFMQ